MIFRKYRLLCYRFLFKGDMFNLPYFCSLWPLDMSCEFDTRPFTE